MTSLLYRENGGNPEHYCRVDWAAGLAENCVWPHTIRMPWKPKTKHAVPEDVLGVNDE